ncbi:MAG: thiamine phosphate synthase [Chloroflexi bacterium]|nr:thiamine phosphate synthase [Chloroflexota bacterium]
MLRLVDANLDRLGEGLRVLEDVSRFLLDDAALSRRLKALRHSLVKDLVPLEQELLAARRVAGDVGAPRSTAAVPHHEDLMALVTANSRRVQESIRVLEEFARLSGSPVAAKPARLQRLRFEVYELERELVSRLLRHDRLGRLSGLCVIVDSAALKGRGEVEVAARAIKGGARVIQFRDKHSARVRLLYVARWLKELCAEKGALFIVNDHLDIALAVGADGLHLGQDDLPVGEARRMLPMDTLIGCSVTGVAQALRAQASGADYIGIGAIYRTPSKKESRPVGLAALKRVRARVSLPVIAIGGINHGNVKEVIKAGADGVAVISAVLGADDIERATRRLVARIGQN